MKLVLVLSSCRSSNLQSWTGYLLILMFSFRKHGNLSNSKMLQFFSLYQDLIIVTFTFQLAIPIFPLIKVSL